MCGDVYGLGLARYLFESQPQRFSILGAWPGVLLTSLLCGGAAVILLTPLRALRDKLIPAASAPSAFAPLPCLLPLLSVLSPDVNLLRAQALLLGGLALFLLLFFTAELAEGAEKLPSEPSADISEHRVTPSLHHLVFSFSLFLLLITLYLRTLGSTVGEADPFEFQVSAYRLGIAHGNGYPLLMLLGKLFTLLPVGGTLAFRANLTSAFFAALAAVGVERLARRLRAAPLTAFLAGFAFGVSPTLWARATELEAYALNAAFLVVILYLCIELVDQQPVVRSASSVYLLAFLLGLGLTNHLTTLLAAPACVIAGGGWLSTQLRHTPHALRSAIRHLSFVILFFLLGLAIYLYLPLRWPSVNHGELLSLDRFLHIVKGGESAGEFNPALALTDAVRYGSLFRKIVDQYTWAGIALAAAGVVALVLRGSSQKPVLLRKKGFSVPGWPIVLILALTYAGHVFFIMAYFTRDPDWSDFFIPLHLMAAVLIGVGAQAILNALFTLLNSRFSSNTAFPPLPAARCLLLTAFCLLPLRSIWLTLPQVDRSQNWANYRLGQYTLSYPLAQGATILVDPVRLAPLYYLQVVEGVRPDLDIILLPDEASYRAVLDERLAAGQRVYLARYLPGLGSAYSLRSIGPLAEVSPSPFTASPKIAHRLSTTLASNIHLLGFNVDTQSVAAPDPLRLTLFWRADDPADNNYLVSLRLVDASGQMAWQSPGSLPVSGLYPTNAWRPSEVISDFYSVPIGAGLAPGDYRLQAGMFPPFQVSADAGWADVTPITILPSTESPKPPHPLRAKFDDHWLMGYAAPESVAPGSHVTVTLYWLRGIGNDTVTAFGETRSLAAWPVGSVIPLEYRLTAPTSEERFDLVVDSEHASRARCGWLASITPACQLPSIQLAGAAIAQGANNFNNQLVLRRATIDTPTVERGGQVNITLEWQGLQTIAEDYTVFVHLVGPDGMLHGQVDFYPVKGTLATSHWTPGQVIHDPYTVPVPTDAPPGAYTVHVGMYLLATLERLPVLNADGAPLDDKVVLTGLRVK